MPQLPITNGFYLSDSLPVSHQECVNWYVNPVQGGGMAQEVLYGCPGMEQLLTTGATEINRGSYVKAGIPYFVNKNTLYRIDRSIVDGVTTYSSVSLGTISGTGRVSMAANDSQLMILVPGGDGYIYDESAGTPFQQITDVDFTANGDPQHVVFIDGYFACTTDTKKWIISALNDGLTWSALDFGTAESDPDVIVAPVVLRNQIYIAGSETTEGFQNVGGAGFPFQRNNVFLDKGCYAPFSIVATNQRFFMVGGGKNESPAVWEFSGNNYTKISTVAIDNILGDYTDSQIAEIYSYSYAQRGAYFVGFSLPDRAIEYNMITGKWNERKSLIDGTETAFRVASMVVAYGKVLVGDTQDGRIGSLDPDIYGEYGNDIYRRVSTMPFVDLKSYTVPNLELTVESGVGNNDVEDPVITMAISEDSKTFQYPRSRKIGKKGKFQHRVIWRKNGRIPRFAIARFLLSDQVKPVIIRLDSK